MNESIERAGSHDYLLKIHAPNMKYYQGRLIVWIHWKVLLQWLRET